jgi:hypothetical protein
MSSSNTTVNTVRKALLSGALTGAQAALNNDAGGVLESKLRSVSSVVDGSPSPPDWVSGEAADTLSGYVDFALQVLSAYGL